jgi:uncharacterized protein YcfJ
VAAKAEVCRASCFVEAADLKDQRIESTGLTGGAVAAGHLGNATREFNTTDVIDVIRPAVGGGFNL